MTEQPLPHLDAEGRAHMVDVSAKPATRRRAMAEGGVRMKASTLEAIRRRDLAKGDVLAVARIAGIQGAKSTAQIVPLCHPVRLDAVEIEVEPQGEDCVRIRATATAFDRTGVEMEALSAVLAASLAVYDMVKSIDRAAVIEGARLLSKEGGRSGTWTREGTGGTL